MQCSDQEICCCINCRNAAKPKPFTPKTPNCNFTDNSKSQKLKNLCKTIKKDGIATGNQSIKKYITLDRLAEAVDNEPDGIISLCWLGRHQNLLDFSDEDLMNRGKKCKIYLVCNEYDDDLDCCSDEDFDGSLCMDCCCCNDSLIDESYKPTATNSSLDMECSQILDEMLVLCEIINEYGYAVSDEPDMKAISYGELYEIYLFKNMDKEKNDLASICHIARNHCLIQFEGEYLTVPQDEDVAIFLIQSIEEIRRIIGSGESAPFGRNEEIKEPTQNFEAPSENIGNVEAKNLSSKSKENYLQDEIPQPKSELKVKPDIDENKTFEELNNYCKCAYQCASNLCNASSIHILITCQKEGESKNCDFMIGEGSGQCQAPNAQTVPKESRSEFCQTEVTSLKNEYCQTDFDLSLPCPEKLVNPEKDVQKEPLTKAIDEPQIPKKEPKKTRQSCTIYCCKDISKNNTEKPCLRSLTQINASEKMVCRCSQLEITFGKCCPKSKDNDDFKTIPEEINVDKALENKVKKSDSNMTLGKPSNKSQKPSRNDKLSSKPNEKRKVGGSSRSNSLSRPKSSKVVISENENSQKNEASVKRKPKESPLGESNKKQSSLKKRSTPSSGKSKPRSKDNTSSVFKYPKSQENISDPTQCNVKCDKDIKILINVQKQKSYQPKNI